MTRRLRGAAAIVLLSALLVTSIDAVHTAAGASTPNDPSFTLQWGLSRIGAPTAWDTATGVGVTIAVLDTGIDLSHLDLAAKLLPGYNYVSPGSSPQDDHSHGTHVAGIAAAVTNNGVGVAGTAPGAQLLPVKVLDANGEGSGANVDAGIRFAANRGAKVINLSLGGFAQGITGASFGDPCNYAYSVGSLCVVAAGNDYITGSGFGSENLLVVAATNKSDGKPTYSSGVGSAKWGISAPGGGDAIVTSDANQAIYSTVPGGYGYKAGTSMAAPHVAGAAAVLFSLGLNNDQVVQRLLSTAKDLGNSSTFGAGRLDLAAAVSGLTPPPAPTTTTTTTAGSSTTTSTTTSSSATTTTAPGSTTTTAPGSPTTTTPPSSTSDTVRRLLGADRMETAIAISRDDYASRPAGGVVLARADTFPDALAGTPLAAKVDGPLLLTAQPSLDGRTRDELRRVLPAGGTVHLLGGAAALSTGIENELVSLGYRTVRYSGADRFDTAVRVARDGLGDPSTLLLADGLDFTDALVAGAVAPSVKGALLLTAGSSMPPATARHIEAHHGGTRYAVGRPAALADPGAMALYGADPPATSRRVAEALVPDVRVVGVATFTSFPDALGGGAHTARRAGALVLTDPRVLSPVVEEYLRGRASAIDTAFVYGGPAAVSDQAVEGVARAIS